MKDNLELHEFSLEAIIAQLFGAAMTESRSRPMNELI
jgi:hypothetical protein